jgi:hypothetical protein
MGDVNKKSEKSKKPYSLLASAATSSLVIELACALRR